VRIRERRTTLTVPGTLSSVLGARVLRDSDDNRRATGSESDVAKTVPVGGGLTTIVTPSPDPPVPDDGPRTYHTIQRFPLQSYLSSPLPPVFGEIPEETDNLFEWSDFHKTESKFATEGSDAIHIAIRWVSF